MAEACSSCDAIAPAGLIGRLSKFVVGLAQLGFVYTLVTQVVPNPPDQPSTNPMYWVGIGLAYALLSWTVNLGFRKTWRSWPFVVAIAVTGLAAGYDWVAYGTLWAAPLSTVTALVAVYVHGHMGMCHTLAAILGTPGCEMRAFDHLKTKIAGGEAKLTVCPGFWARLDEWEDNLRRRMRHQDPVAYREAKE